MTLWNNEDISGRLYEAGERKRAGEDQYHEDCEYIGLLTYHCSYLDMDNKYLLE